MTISMIVHVNTEVLTTALLLGNKMAKTEMFAQQTQRQRRGNDNLYK